RDDVKICSCRAVLSLQVFSVPSYVACLACEFIHLVSPTVKNSGGDFRKVRGFQEKNIVYAVAVWRKHVGNFQTCSNINVYAERVAVLATALCREQNYLICSRTLVLCFYGFRNYCLCFTCSVTKTPHRCDALIIYA